MVRILDSKIYWKLREFNTLSKNEMYEILKARQDVFIVEQKCSFMEIDNLDKQSMHLSGYLVCDNQKFLATYLRLSEHTYDKQKMIFSRVLVNKLYRNLGLGKMLLQKAILISLTNKSIKIIKLSAQVNTKFFYKSLGFVEVSSSYLEDNIPHLDMEYYVNP